MNSVTLAYYLKKRTSKLNEKCNEDTANTNKGCENRRQQDKLKNQTRYVRKSHHPKYRESRLRNKNLKNMYS